MNTSNLSQPIKIKPCSQEVLRNLLVNYFGQDVDTKSITDSIFLFGKNAQDNWNIYKASKQTDTIFHLDKLSSPYVIINVPMEFLTKEQIYAAALLCKSKSKYKNMANIGILYTPISNTVLGFVPGSFIVLSNHKKTVVNV